MKILLLIITLQFPEVTTRRRRIGWVVLNFHEEVQDKNPVQVC